MAASSILLLCSSSAAQKCGTERWAVKTSADADASKVHTADPIPSTVYALNGFPAPSRQDLNAHANSRFPQETVAYSVKAYLYGFKLEADEDLHIVLQDLQTDATMVVEMPSEKCVPQEIAGMSAALRTSFEAEFGRATKRFKRTINRKVEVEIVGIGFFDFVHGQTGVAKNGFELHRVISWREVKQ